MSFFKASLSSFSNWTRMTTNNSSSRTLSALSNLKNNPVQQSGDELSIQLNGKFAVITYENITKNVYNLVHTFVPDEYQGQGLGSVLAERVFQHLIENDKRFRLTCDFLKHYYSKNKEKYADFVVD